MQSPESLFSARIAADPGRPLVTFYDDATGERAELSAKSLGNWVAKTHFLLIDELGLGVGDRAFVSLPVHWLAAAVLLGCWFAGLEVVTEPGDAVIAFGDVASLSAADLDSVGDVLAVSLLSMARSAEAPAGMTDYASAVRPQPDSWPTVHARATSADVALNGRTRSDVVADANAAAERLGLTLGGRLLWKSAGFSSPEWISALLAPLAVGGSVVLVRHADESKTRARAAAENVTAIA